MKRAFAHIGFSFGVTLFVLNAFGAEVAIYAAVALAGVFICAVSLPNLRRGVSLPLCAGSALFACLLFLYAYHAVVLPQLALGNKTADCVFYLTNLGEPTTSGYAYTANVRAVGIAGAPQNIHIRLYCKEQIPASGYQLISGNLRFHSYGESGFSSYGAWGKEIFLKANLKDYEVTDKLLNPTMRQILKLRYKLKESVMNGVGGDEGALAVGMLIGDKSYISQEVYRAFRITGAAHLTAVSGLHLGAVTGVFRFAFDKLHVTKKISAPILIVIIAFYCVLSGLSKSVLRAGIMLAILLVGEVFKSRADSLNSLGFALFVLCLNPFAVCDISTLLTTICVLAIVAVYPKITGSRPFKKFKRQLRKLGKGEIAYKVAGFIIRITELVILSFSIVLCSMPVMAIFFGGFSAIGIVLNVIIVMLGTVSVTVTLIAILPLHLWFAVRIVNRLIIAIVMSASKFPLAFVVLGKSFIVVLGAALVFIGVGVFISKSAAGKAAVSTVIAMAVFICAFTVYDNHCSHILVTKTGAAVVSTNGSVTVYGVDSANDYYTVKGYLDSQNVKADTAVNCSKQYLQRFKETYSATKTVTVNQPYSVKAGGVTFAAGNGASGNIVLCGKSLYTAGGGGELENDVIITVTTDAYSAEPYMPSVLT